jgi:molybdopterin/thiamine biosynthesis adenylyltransferase
MSEAVTIASDLVQPRLKPTVEVFPARSGDLYFLRPGCEEFVVRSAGAFERALLERLDGSRSVAELAGDLAARGLCDADGDQVAQAVSDLEAAGLVEDAHSDGRYGLTASEIERFDRQLRYFGDLFRGPRAVPHARLRGSTVLVLGLGGFGSWAVQALVSAGVGRIVGVDGDVVESSNLNRQILYGESDVGRAKAHAAADSVRRLSRYTDFRAIEQRVESPAAIDALLDGVDLVIDAADWPPGQLERWVNAACYSAGVPFILASHFPPSVRVGPVHVPGRTPCHACELDALGEEHPILDEYLAWRGERPTESATFGPACALIGGLLANEAVTLLGGLGDPATINGACDLNLKTLTVRAEPRRAVAACDLCRPAPATRSSRVAAVSAG